MNPLLELLQQLMSNGGFPGIPTSFNPAIASAFTQYKDFQSAQDKSRQYNTNTDPLKDIEAYRVNPHRGYIAKYGGLAEEGSMLASLVPFIMPGSNLMPQGTDITRGLLTPLVQKMVGENIEMQKMRQGGLINQTGYTPGTSSYNNPMNIIPSNNITMKNTPFPVMAFPDKGLASLLMPGTEAHFPGASSVMEIPIMKKGGLIGGHYGLGTIEHYDRGGRIQKRKERLERELQEAQKKGKTGQIRRLSRRLEDIAAGGSGLTGIGRGFENAGNMLAQQMQLVGKAASFIPGVGQVIGGAIGAGGGLLNNLVTTDAERGVGLYGGQQPPNPANQGQMFDPAMVAQSTYTPAGSLFNRINPPQTPSFGLFNGNFNQGPGIMANTVPQNPLSYLSQQFQGAVPDASGGIAGGLATPPFMGGNMSGGMAGAMGLPMGDITNLLTSLMPLFNQNQQGTGKYGGTVKKKKKKYQMGGIVEGEEEPAMVPIQAEKGEMIIHLDNTITKVNAIKKHSQMDKDEVTDIVPEGSYIASADKSMKISWKKADDIVIAVRSLPYEEQKQGKIPEEIKLSSLWPKNSKRDMTVAELTELVLKTYPTIDREDIFTKLTNESNINSRTPYLAHIVRLSEELKDEDDSMIVGYKKGGKVKKYQEGGQAGTDWLALAGNLIPLLGNLFGGKQGQQGTPQGVGQISPLVQNGILATVPAYQQGVNMNVAAQQGVLGQGIEDFSALGNQLIQNARQSAAGQGMANLGVTGLGALNALGTETNLPRLDLGASRSRINNYSPSSATRAAVDAAATPRYDTRAIMQELGSRGGSVLAQLESQRQGNVNAAAMQRGQIIDQTNLSKIGQLNQIDMTEQPFNIQQQEKERLLREQRRSGLTGSLAGGMQRGADIQTGLLGQEGNIQSQILPILQGMSMQNAQLVGQPLMLGSQNALNALGMLGGMQSSNNLAAYMQNNQPGTTVPGTNPGATGGTGGAGGAGGTTGGATGGSNPNPYAGWTPAATGGFMAQNGACPAGTCLNAQLQTCEYC